MLLWLIYQVTQKAASFEWCQEKKKALLQVSLCANCSAIWVREPSRSSGAGGGGGGQVWCLELLAGPQN